MDTPDPNRPVKRGLHPAMVRALYGLLIVGLLAALGFTGRIVYKKMRHAMLMARAQKALEKKEYTQAAMTARWALDVQPGDVEAMRLIAKVATEAGSRDAAKLQRAVAEWEPQDPENYLRWANTALRSGDLVNVRLALDGMRAAKLETAAYFDARARLADAEGHPENIEAAMAEAVRLEPQNPTYRLRHASMQTGSADLAIRDRALATIEELTEVPETRRAALRVLLHAAMLRRDGPKAVSVAERLRNGPDAKLEDQLVYLGIMRKASRWEFWWALGQLQVRLADQPGEITETIRWMVRNDLAPVAVDWGKRIPNEMRFKPPLAIAISEALTVARDWEGLRPYVRGGEWGELDFQRRALLAKVLRQSGDDAGSRGQWSSAVSLAGDRVVAYDTLMTLTRLWGWEAEQTALLWVVARGEAAPKPALAELLRRNLLIGRTQDLLAVFTRQLELDPTDTEAKNNVAYAALLLGTDRRRAETLALEVYRADPQNPGFAATYAFALHSASKHAEGLKVVSTISADGLKVPATVLTRALLLAATGEREGALQDFATAEKGKLLPEEKALLTRARAKLAAP